MSENKFNGMGKIYSKYRPAYSFNFIDYLFTNVGISQSSIIADIGSGTGILTKQLLEKGSKVYGIEPNADMRVIAETNLKSFSKFMEVLRILLLLTIVLTTLLLHRLSIGLIEKDLKKSASVF